MQTQNPDYPPDYDEYLAYCYNAKHGEALESYEDWKARCPVTNGERS